MFTAWTPSFHEGHTSVSISQNHQHRCSDGFHSNNYMTWNSSSSKCVFTMCEAPCSAYISWCNPHDKSLNLENYSSLLGTEELNCLRHSCEIGVEIWTCEDQGQHLHTHHHHTMPPLESQEEAAWASATLCLPVWCWSLCQQLVVICFLTVMLTCVFEFSLLIYFSSKSLWSMVQTRRT